jgi:hypothetical protein
MYVPTSQVYVTFVWAFCVIVSVYILFVGVSELLSVMKFMKCFKYFSVDENATGQKYFDLRTSAVWRFQKVDICLNMAM